MLKTLATAVLSLVAASLVAMPACAQEGQSPPKVSSPAPSAEKTLVIVLSVTGKTQKLAELIAAGTGADICRIQPEPPLPADESQIITIEQARRDEGIAPVFRGLPPDISSYSLVFVGSPVWFGDTPDVVKLFLDKIDFSGKKVALFATAGSRPGEIISQLSGLLKGADILEPSLVQVRADDWGDEALKAKVDGYLAKVKTAQSESAAPAR
jgi:flavodoxin